MDYGNWNKIFNSIRKREGNTFIQSRLDASLDVNDKCDKTMLSYAAQCGNLEIIEFLLQKGADGNVMNSDGSKPLHVAAFNGHTDIVKLFLNLGVFVDSCDHCNCTPLHYVGGKSNIPVAATESYQELVHILLDSNADLNAVNRTGCTPLLLAARNGRTDIVELFIKLGANVECHNDYRQTVLHYSCQKGWIELVRSLVEGFDIDLNARTSEGKTPLIVAADFSHKNIVQLLIEYGADVNCKDYLDRTILYYAWTKEWFDVVTSVVDNGCDLDSKVIRYNGYEDYTLLQLACVKGWLSVVKYLVSKNCDLNATTGRSKTPLLLAAIHSHENIVRLLINYGANVKGKRSLPVLHFACKNGWFGVVKSFAKKKCDLNAKGFTGETPLLLAAIHSRKDIVQLLIRYGANVKGKSSSNKQTVLHFACKNGWLDVLKSLVNEGSDLNAKDFTGETPLLLAAIHSRKDIAQLLIGYGANVKDKSSSNKQTVLHFACENGWLDVVKSLVNEGSDLNARNKVCETPLHKAVEYLNLEIIEHLLKASADPNVKNAEGKTAFQIFIQKHQSLQLTALFLNNGAYFQLNDYVAMFPNSLLGDELLQYMELCIRVIMNKFNNTDLPRIYKIPVLSSSLPSIEKLKIATNTKVAWDIAQSVEYDIQTNGYCNLFDNHPIALSILCVRSLIEHYDS